MPGLEDQGDAKNLNRGEKKCRKALLKLGMKELTGITRVSLRKRDGLIFVINEPQVLKSTDNAQSFAIFGELRLEDPNSRLSQTEAKLVQLMSNGMMLDEAAEELSISVHTARTHLKHIFHKTGLNRQAELIHRIGCGPASLLLQIAPVPGLRP